MSLGPELEPSRNVGMYSNGNTSPGGPYGIPPIDDRARILALTSPLLTPDLTAARAATTARLVLVAYQIWTSARSSPK
jgi:hypothetical protein